MIRHVEIAEERHLETLRRCGGFYDCPISEGTGERMGPLVGYAGKYQGPNGLQLQWVGETYANFAMAEIHPNVLLFFARCLATKAESIIDIADIDVLCGAPIGGYSLATALGMITDNNVIKAEKKVTALATESAREKSKLVFGRHSVEKGLRYAIVEDVCNNFSTTEELINLICSAGGDVSAILCFLNRSMKVDSQYRSLSMSRDIPVISLVRLTIEEWKQDDPAVADDIARGNVSWKPKDDWDKLMKAMQPFV